MTDEEIRRWALERALDWLQHGSYASPGDVVEAAEKFEGYVTGTDHVTTPQLEKYVTGGQ